MSAAAGLILAGGRGSRLGSPVPKALVPLAGRPLIEHVRTRLAPLSPILVSANEPAAFAGLGLPIVGDRVPGFAGPLAGLDAAAAWLEANCPGTAWVLAVAADTPFLPSDLLERMRPEPGGAVRIASHRGRLHPTVALWPLAVLRRLPAWLQDDGHRSLKGFLSDLEHCIVEFPDAPDAPSGDPFFNINTPADLAAARALMEPG